MTPLRIFFVASVLSISALNAATFEPLTAQEQRSFKNVQEKLAAVDKQPEALIPVKDVRGWLRTKEFLSDGTENWNWERFESNYREKLNAQGGAATAADVAQFGPYKRPERIEPHREPLKLRIRQSFTDVLAIEDPSQEIDTGRTSDDLEGALFSYQRDRKADKDTWAAQGALLLPIIYVTGAERSMKRWATLTYGVVPSVSIHRLTTEERTPEDKPSEEIDLLTYRLGVFGKWSVPGNVVDTLTVRGFATYVSDTGMETGIPVAQVEVEPQIFVNDKLGIGYRMNLIPKHVPLIPGKTDYDDNSWLGYQLRLRLHAEYGRVVDAGRTGLETESFFRIGPITELKIAPLIWKNLSVTLAYSYLPAVTGPDNHNTLFTADAQWILIDDKDKNGTLSLKANYTRGGIDVTEQKVDTFQIGLGATF